MPNSQQLGGQIQNLANQYNTFDPNAGQKVRNSINNAVLNFRPQIEELENIKTGAYNVLPQGMADYARLYSDNQAQGPGSIIDPVQYLATLQKNYNTQMGRANALSGVIGQMGGKLDTIVGDVRDMYNTGYENLGRQISALNPLFQSAVNTENAEKQRLFEEQQAALSRQAELDRLNKSLAAQAAESAANRALQRSQINSSRLDINSILKGQKQMEQDQITNTINRLPSVINLRDESQKQALQFIGAQPIYKPMVGPILNGQQRPQRITGYKLPNGKIIQAS